MQTCKVIPFPLSQTPPVSSGPVIHIGRRLFRVRDNARFSWLWQWILNEFTEPV